MPPANEIKDSSFEHAQISAAIEQVLLFHAQMLLDSLGVKVLCSHFNTPAGIDSCVYIDLFDLSYHEGTKWLAGEVSLHGKWHVGMLAFAMVWGRLVPPHLLTWFLRFELHKAYLVNTGGITRLDVMVSVLSPSRHKAISIGGIGYKSVTLLYHSTETTRGSPRMNDRLCYADE